MDELVVVRVTPRAKATVRLPAREARCALRLADHTLARTADARTRAELARLRNLLAEGLEPEYARRRQLRRDQKARYIAAHRERYLAYQREYARRKRAAGKGEAA